jgi:hypothetical protein
MRKALRRFRLLGEGPGKIDSIEPYMSRARQVMAEHPDVAVYVFGHTHDAFLEQIDDGRAVINTGTWLKILNRVQARARFPAVYVPSFRLNYFRIREAEGEVLIDYVEVPKTPESELSWLQRLAIWRKRRPEHSEIAARTTITMEERGSRAA